MLNYELLGIIIMLGGSIIKFSLDYSKLRTMILAQELRIAELEQQKETIFNRIDELKEHNNKGLADLELTLMRVETKLDLIMTKFEMNIKD